MSHGFGFATRATFDDKRNHLLGNFHIQSRNFASLAVNNQHGTFADLNASRKLTERLYASLDLNQSNYNLLTLSQNTFTSSGLLNFKLNTEFLRQRRRRIRNVPIEDSRWACRDHRESACGRGLFNTAFWDGIRVSAHSQH